jgi:hypothetical protein
LPGERNLGNLHLSADGCRQRGYDLGSADVYSGKGVVHRELDMAFKSYRENPTFRISATVETRLDYMCIISSGSQIEYRRSFFEWLPRRESFAAAARLYLIRID